MSSAKSFSNSEEFIAHLQKIDEESGHALIAEFFNRGVEHHIRSEKLSAELSSARRKIIEIQAVNTELRNEIAANISSSSDLLQSSAVDKYRLAENQNLIKSLEARLASTSESGIPSGGVNKSELFRIDEKFTGLDKSLYPSFQRQIKIALAQNSDRYIGLQSQISLIYQNLGPGPKSFLDRYLSDSGQFQFESLSAVWDVLDISYKNLNEEDDAREALNSLRQSSQPFGMYLAEFQRLHNLSRISDHKTLISCMRNGITPELRSCVSQHQDIHNTYTFDEYVNLCKDCVVRLGLNRPSNTTPVNLTPSRVNHPTLSQGNHLTASRGFNLTPPRSHPTVNPVASGANGVPLGGDPMELDQYDISHIGPDGHITPEERQRRFKLKLCMRCGGPGHRAENCRPKNKGKGKMIALAEVDEEMSFEYGSSELKD